MSVTADQVDLVFNAKNDKYLADLARMESEFRSKMASISWSAVQAGKATAVAFDPIENSFTRVTENVKKTQTEVDKLSKSFNANRMQVGNLAAQFNDIGVTLAGGMSPFTVALQQGTQIGQVFSQIEGGILPSLRAAFMQILSPVNLATIGIIALGGYVVQWAMEVASASGEVRKLDDVLREHKETIDRIKKAYGEAARARKEFTAADAAQISSNLRTSQSQAESAMRRSSADFFASQGIAGTDVFYLKSYGPFQSVIDDLKSSAAESLPTFEELRKKLIDVYTAALAEGKDPASLGSLLAYALDAGNAFLTIPEKLQPFAEAIQTLRSELENNVPGAVDRFVASVASIGDQTPALQGTADALIQGSIELGKWADLAADAAAQQEYLTSAAGQYNLAVQELQNAIENVRSDTARKELQELADKAAESGISIDDVKNKLAELSGTAPDLSAAISQFLSLFNAVNATREALVGFQGAASTGGPARYQSNAVTLPDVGPVPEGRGTPELGGFPWENFGKKGRGRKGRASENEYQRLTRQINERTKALQAETQAQADLNPLIEDYGYAAEKAKLEAQLLSAAEKAKIAITPELRESITATAEAYAAASAASKQLADSQKKVKKHMEDMRDLGKDVVGGFISDLRRGTSASEALANALNKVLDKIIDISLESIFSGVGGGGGLLGGLFSIFGFSKGGIASGGKPIKTFARGGTSRSAAIFAERGPEAAVPLPDGRSIPVTIREPRTASGPSNEVITINLEADPSIIADVADQRIRSASGTIVQVAVNQSNRSAPSAVAKYQQSKAGGDYRNS